MIELDNEYDFPNGSVWNPGFGSAKLLVDRSFIIRKVLNRINENKRRYNKKS